jgi:hypothetical protein
MLRTIGCFTVILTKRNQLNWRVIVSFEINLHIKDIAILYKIKEFFGVLSVYSMQNKSKCVYRVTKIEDLINVIIPHFLTYPLITYKYSDFILWSKVVKLMVTKEHLTSSGFLTILSYYASINKGISPRLKSAFPNIKAQEKVNVYLPVNLNKHCIQVLQLVMGDFQ